MRLKLRVTLESDQARDVVVSCDVTTSIGAIAEAINRAHPPGSSSTLDGGSLATLRMIPAAGGAPVMLDRMATVSHSGLHSGATVSVVGELDTTAAEQFAAPPIAIAEAAAGRGTRVALPLGESLIGRGSLCRVRLTDRSVSRTHAAITVEPDGMISVRDLDSANGIRVAGKRTLGERAPAPLELQLGTVTLRILRLPNGQDLPSLDTQIDAPPAHVRAPRAVHRFAGHKRTLPAPPTAAEPHRVPVLAMLLPALMGGVMFAITRSPMSLIMAAFSPVMMASSWLDGRVSARRKFARERAVFTASLRSESAEIEAVHRAETHARHAESPPVQEVLAAMVQRDALLWSCRPEHPGFLELRLGTGRSASRTELVLPERGSAPPELWSEIERVAQQFRQLENVPIIERLDRCGNIGVAADPARASGIVRSLILQLVGLRSPAELVLTACIDPHAASDWEWLVWLPHTDGIGSPVRAPHLAVASSQATKLVIALEGLVEERSTCAHTVPASDAEPPQTPLPTVIVLIIGAPQVEQSRLIHLTECGPRVGVHVIWAADEVQQLPGACRTYLAPEGTSGTDALCVSSTQEGSSVRLDTHDTATLAEAERAARALAPVIDAGHRVHDESDIPVSVHLRDAHPVDVLGGTAAILAEWQAPGPPATKVVIGVGADSPVSLDLRVQGPHALVGGTTGSGKSEFLQTWIMSMAASQSPERLSFLLVDYKGGAAFAECVDLPHTVGLVTDLSPHLVRRALRSLRAELTYRETLLAEHGAKDLAAMEQDAALKAPPSLVIVVDEFAALAREVPEFVTGVIDIAQRGRSLGLHLVLATQRPAGVINDNLRANTNLRIALRTADASDSTDVLGTPEAASFPVDQPGRAAVRCGPDRVEHFQTAYLGGHAAVAANGPEISVTPLGWVPEEDDSAPQRRLRMSSRVRAPRTGLRDIERLRDTIVDAARSAQTRVPRRPWLDELPTRIGLDELPACAGQPSLALLDDPDAQAQDPVNWDLEQVGNIALFGASGSGKTSALFTIAVTLSSAGGLRAIGGTEPVHIYGIDAASGALSALAPLPAVGAIAVLTETERVERILRHVTETIAAREIEFARARVGTLREFRAATGQTELPRIVLLVDGFGTFRDVTDTFQAKGAAFADLISIMSKGRAVGVHVVVTADRAAAIPASVMASIQLQLVFRLANASEYGHFGVPGDALESAPPGRAIAVGDDRLLQFATLSSAVLLADQATAIERLARELRATGAAVAPEIRTAPEQLALLELPREDAGRPVVGIRTSDFAPATLPPAGLGVIAGPGGSGKTEALLSCTAAFERWAQARNEFADAMLLTPSAHGLAARRAWAAVAVGPDAGVLLADRILRAFGVAPPQPSTSALLGAARIGSSDPEPDRDADTASTSDDPRSFSPPRLVVVEGSATLDSGPMLERVIALVKLARRANFLLLIDCEQGSGGTNWELFSAMKQPSWGVQLQPDDGETHTPFREDFGRVKRTDFPAGRGYAVERGVVTGIHIALSALTVQSTGKVSYS